MIYVFNTTIAVPSELPATFQMREISSGDVKRILESDYTSAIGHQGSADVIEAVTGVSVSVNRITAAMKVGDEAVCLKLNGRIPEGAVLTREQCEEVGYSFIYMERTA